MNDCLNITAAVHKDDKRCLEEKLYGKRRIKQAWPFMMPGFRHRNRPTKMHDTGERCFYLNSDNDHSSDTHKVITPAGITMYSAHCTFAYRRQAFQGEMPTWGGEAVTSSRSWPSTASSPEAAPDPSAAVTSSRGGGIAASAAPRGGGIPPMSSSGAAAAAGASWISSCGESVLPAFSSARAPAASEAPRGGGIPPMSSSGAVATSAAAATSSRGGGIPAAVPAAEVTDGTHVSGSGVGPPAVVGASPTPPASNPSVGAGAATGELLATEQEKEQLIGGTHVSGSGVGPPAVVGASPTPPASDPSTGAGAATAEILAPEQEQEQLVASGGCREVLDKVSRMAGGTSLVGPGALPAASSAPPGPSPTSEEMWAGMVHDGGAGGRWQGQRVTPAVTRSRAKRDGLRPGMFAFMATQEDIARSIAELSPPDVVEQELPSELACDLETPETYVQAHAGSHSGIWTEAEGKELRGFNATGTFEVAGSE